MRHEMQCAFMPGCGITHAIFNLRPLQDKYLAKRNNLYFSFVELENTFHRVPNNIVQSIYRNPRSCVRVNGTFCDHFLIQVRLHQGSVLSPLFGSVLSPLFIKVLEVLSREIKSGCPEELLYADA